jgi:hypothetical protein
MCPGSDTAIALHKARSAQPPLLELVEEAKNTASPLPASGPNSSGIPEPDDEGPLYIARRKIYPQGVKGTYRAIKWAVLLVTLGIYYALPFVRWDRGLNAPNQGVLVDFPNRRFYFFFIEIWP